MRLQIAGGLGIPRLIHLFRLDTIPPQHQRPHLLERTILGTYQPGRVTHDNPWRKKEETVKRSPCHYKLIPSGMLDLASVVRQPLNDRSFQDALRAFFPPMKCDDSRLDFYAMYKREATEYDTDYVKKYDEDLNTTLIFVRRLPFAPANYLTYPYRQVCSLPSVLPL